MSNREEGGTPRRVGRFLMVGGVNTAFGYLVFALFNYLFSEIPYGYIAAAIVSNIVAITVAFVNYKFFVFHTQGNYLREYLRFYLVYGVSAAVSLAILPLLVEGMRIDSYLAALMLIPVNVLLSFFGHTTISFAETPAKHEVNDG